MRRTLRAIFSARSLRRLGLVLLLIVATPVALLIADDLRGRVLWSRYCSDAQRRGLKVDLLEFIPPAPATDQNLGSLEMFTKAFAAVQRGEPADNPFERPPFPRVKPGAGLDSGERAALAPWRDGFVRAQWIPAASDNAAEDLLAALEKVAPALAELHAGLERPTALFTVEWEKGMYAEFPHLAIIEGAAYLLRLRAMSRLELGDNKGAFEDLREIAKLSRALLDAPTVVMALARASLQSQLLEVVWHGLAVHGWTDEQLTSLNEMLATFDPLAEWSHALDSERGSINRMFELLLSGEYERLAAKYGDLSGAIGDPNLRYARKLPGWTRLNQLRLNRHLEDMRGRVRVSDGLLVHDQPLPLRPDLLTGSFQKKYYRAFIVATPAVTVPEERILQLAARFRLARMAVALERFHRARGAYPDRLEELVPALLEDIPHEVTSREPMHYHRTDKGDYLLYSMGLNGSDDSGERSATGRRVPPRDQPDWPWPAPPAK